MALAVNIRSVRILRAEHAHLVASIVVVVGIAASCQSAIGDEQVVIATYVFNIGGLTRCIIAAGYLLAEIGVNGDAVTTTRQSILNIVVAKACILVQFKHVDTSAP